MTEKYNVDFYKVYVNETYDPRAKFDYEICIDFKYRNVKDLIVKGGEFHGFWNGVTWSNHMDDLIEIIDNDIHMLYNKTRHEHPDAKIKVGYMNYESSGIMLRFQNYCKKQSSSTAQFNTKILFSDHHIIRDDYSTYQLPYTPTPGPTRAFDELTSILYEPEELDKVLWAIGALFTGDIAKIQKFLYLYGPKGTGKGTMIDIIRDLIGEYIGTIDLQTFTGPSEFATGVFQEAPVLLDSDSDISKINKEMNLLKLTAHEEFIVRRLHKPGYPVLFTGLLITASNEKYKVKNIDSGITRRALVVHPTGNRVEMHRYFELKNQIKYEIAYIAQKCIDRYNELGMAYYTDDVDVEMIAYSDKMFDFVREHSTFLQNGVSLKRASELYKVYLEDLGWGTTAYKRDVKQNLGRYFEECIDTYRMEDGTRVRNYFIGFKEDIAFPELVKRQKKVEKTIPKELSYRENKVLDIELKDYKAQYASPKGTPTYKWVNVTTTLKDIDPTQLHYVKPPGNMVVIDFDIKNSKGEKDLELNLAKASTYPKTYMEVSKSGGGIHLHYYYDGDISKLSSIIEPGVEVKTFNGDASLRRMYIESNEEPIASISSGLPFKEDPRVYDENSDFMWNERKLRTFIIRCIRKEHHGATAPEVSFIKHELDRAIANDVKFDLSDMLDDVMSFAMRSKNQYNKCIAMVNDMVFKNVDEPKEVDKFISYAKNEIVPDEEIRFYDVEVFQNVFIIVWKRNGVTIPKEYLDSLYIKDGRSHSTFPQNDDYGVWINPTAEQVEWLLHFPLIGFYNRDYDNHIVYNASLGASPMELFNQSQMIVEGSGQDGKMPAAYNISYADLYELHDIKMSLKKWEIKLGIKHDEFEFPWDEPLDVSNWLRAAFYCVNDVDATDAVFNYEKGQAAYTARKILCELTGMPVNTKTQVLAARFMFGNDKRPQDKFVWYDLAKEFPGYTFDKFRKPQSLYLGEEPSEGGYVSSIPGVYGVRKGEPKIVNGRHKDIIYVDVESLHPHSLIAINYFGPYTPKFAALVKCRMLIKHGHFDEASHAFDEIDKALSEKLKPYLSDPSMAGGLGHAMKIIINIIYGMTSAAYDNEFKAPANIDNIVAKRGALFMMTAKRKLEERGVLVIHTKTDSFKLQNWTEEDIKWLDKFADSYGYKFATECIFSKMALVDKANLIGYIEDKDKWEAVGSIFSEPYVYKSLFSKEAVEDKDLLLFKSSNKGPIYVDGTFVGKNAEIFPSLTGGDVVTARNDDVSQKVQARMLKPIEKYLLVRERKDFTPEEIENNRINKIATELSLTSTEVRDIIASGYQPYHVEKRVTVGGTQNFKWKVSKEYTDYHDVDMRYFELMASDAKAQIYEVGDGDLLFED